MAGRFTIQVTGHQAAPPPIADEREDTLRSTSTCSGATSDSSNDGSSISTGDDSDQFGETERGTAPPCIRWGVATSVGGRATMEDAHIIVSDVGGLYKREFGEKKLLSFFGVFDGHGGSEAAKYLQENLLDMLVKQPSFPGRPGEALTEAFLRTDEALYDLVVRQEEQVDSGSTALAALVADGDVIVANAGDSRAVLSRRGKSIDLSRDHKASSITERTRIDAEGGYVNCEGYLNAYLSVGRALGDFTIEGMKQLRADGRLEGPLTANPEVITHTLLPEDEFMVVACDGLWDLLGSQRVVEMARGYLQRDNDPSFCAHSMVEWGLKQDVADNLTIIVVCFSEGPPPPKSHHHASGIPKRCVSNSGLANLNTALGECSEGGLQRCASTNGPFRGSRHPSPMISRRGSESPMGESGSATQPPIRQAKEQLEPPGGNS